MKGLHGAIVWTDVADDLIALTRSSRVDDGTGVVRRFAQLGRVWITGRNFMAIS